MHFEDYEELPTPSVSINMTAGAIAGVLEHCIMYPMDSIKTRMQSLSPLSTGQTIISTFNNMIKNEGLTRPIRGMTAVVAGAGPAHAFYFATYEYTKEVMVKIAPQHHQINYIISAVTATLIHDAISNPTEVIKQRLQMYGSHYKSVIQCTRGVYQNEGLRAFYRSYSTQLVMNLPHQALHFSTYEFFQNTLNKDRRYNPPVHVLAGGAAGAVAAAVTTPLDVIKTLLNTQETGIGLTKGMREAISQIYKVAGPFGFFRGLTARVLYSMPATAICWSTYEFFKYILSSKSREDYKSSVSGKSALQPKDMLHISASTRTAAAAAATGTGPGTSSSSSTTTTTVTPPSPHTTNIMTGIPSSADDRSFSSAGLRRYVLPTATYNNVADNNTDITVTIMKPSRDNAISSSSLPSSASVVYPTATTISLTTIHAAETTGRTFDRSCNT